MAVGITRASRIAAFVIEKARARISNEIKRNDGIIAIFGLNSRIQMQNGGDLFEERVEYAENPNFAFRTKSAQVDTTQSDSWLTAKYGQANLTGSVVVNEIEEDQNKGEYAISKLIEGIINNAKHTVVRQVADSLRATTPGANDPESVKSLVTGTAFGAQTGTTGNLNRASYPTLGHQGPIMVM